MTSLIDTLLDEHHQLFATLDLLRCQGISTPEGQGLLSRIRKQVAAHLAREDRQLYPKMRNHATTRSLADEYEGEMHTISRDLLAFFDKYQHGGDNLEFARGLGRAVARLRQRMTREEIRLYPAFRTHCEALAHA